MNPNDAKSRRMAPLNTPTDLKSNAVRDISGALTTLLADMFALYLKTKNFHWHISGAHFRDYHLLLDEQGDQIFEDSCPVPQQNNCAAHCATAGKLSAFGVRCTSNHPLAAAVRHCSFNYEPEISSLCISSATAESVRAC